MRFSTLLAGGLVLTTLLGCAAVPVVDVDPNRGLDRMPVATYALVIEEMPGFLAPIMRDALVAALAERGATEVASGGDVEFRLRFRQVTLVADDVPSADRFEGTLAPEAASRFVAEAVLSALVPGQTTPVRVGSLSRVHVVSAGAYMHPRAAGAIHSAFGAILDGFIEPAAP